MKVAIAGVTLAAIVVGYIVWGLYKNAHLKPLPTPAAAVVVVPSPAPSVAPKATPNKEADGL